MISLKNTSPASRIIVIDANHLTDSQLLSANIQQNLKNKVAKDLKVLTSIDENGNEIIIAPFFTNQEKDEHTNTEAVRSLGNLVFKLVSDAQLKEISIQSELSKELTYAFVEGLALSNYKFDKYKSKATTLIDKIFVSTENFTEDAVKTLNRIIKSVFYARNIVNEPLSTLKAKEISESAKAIAEETGIHYKELGIDAIRSLKMGGVLGVNQGSELDPTFTVLEWKPENAINKKPIVLVGKGVVYDTGGYSIKVGDGMMAMKCDMGGAAAVFGSTYLAALEKLPQHIITLVPAVENRINEKAFVPGDVLTISDGTTVEVLNTDAEGRLILADALVYAQQFDPEFVFDFATLTGAAMRAIGTGGAAYMGTASDEIKKIALEAANSTHERIAELPLWDDYAEQLKSEVADLSNLGGPLAGASTAGKFLQHFTKYPWLHFDIAAPAFLSSASSYRPVGGTGSGVRFMLEFFKSYIAHVKK
ncbi:MAG TPA: leucyl aminopeptidase family protein [Chitinophagales bacterium]|nr:leucyl aminopeptidase family protein [Chitinophagales bacterium]